MYKFMTLGEQDNEKRLLKYVTIAVNGDDNVNDDFLTYCRRHFKKTGWFYLGLEEVKRLYDNFTQKKD